METLLLALLGKMDNIAIITLTAMLVASGYLHVVWRREEREDRKQLYAMIDQHTRAVEALRTAITLTTRGPV